MPGHPAEHPGPLVFVDDLEEPVLTAEDEHHLGRVLRLRAGDALVVGDGAGRWRPATFGPILHATGPVEHAPAPSPRISVAFGLTKGDKPELVVQKLTELGVDRIVPFRAARSVVQWDDAKADKAAARWRAVARAAAMQCHRPWLPQVDPVTDFPELLGQPGAVLADRGGRPLGLDARVVLVGPEGGWAPEERATAARFGAGCVAVGDHVLRAETAAVTVAALLTGLRAGRVAPVPTARDRRG